MKILYKTLLQTVIVAGALHASPALAREEGRTGGADRVATPAAPSPVLAPVTGGERDASRERGRDDHERDNRDGSYQWKQPTPREAGYGTYQYPHKN